MENSGIDVSDLPEAVQGMAVAVGIAPVLSMVGEFGGQIVSIPKKIGSNRHLSSLDPVLASWLVANWGVYRCDTESRPDGSLSERS